MTAGRQSGKGHNWDHTPNVPTSSRERGGLRWQGRGSCGEKRSAAGGDGKVAGIGAPAATGPHESDFSADLRDQMM
jgi:hypothetical protein